jgi:hypothetical protein
VAGGTTWRPSARIQEMSERPPLFLLMLLMGAQTDFSRPHLSPTLGGNYGLAQSLHEFKIGLRLCSIPVHSQESRTLRY